MLNFYTTQQCSVPVHVVQSSTDFLPCRLEIHVSFDFMCSRGGGQVVRISFLKLTKNDRSKKVDSRTRP